MGMTGITGMTALLSAHSAVKQARVQGGVATQLKGRAGVLEGEIRQDKGCADVKAKEEELASLQDKAQAATASQMTTLADANQKLQEAAKAEREENYRDRREDKKADRKNSKTEKTDISDRNTGEETDEADAGQDLKVSENAESVTAGASAAVRGYRSVDIRL